MRSTADAGPSKAAPRWPSATCTRRSTPRAARRSISAARLGFAEVPGAGGFLVQPGQNAQHQGRNELALLTESELRVAYAFNDRWRADARLHRHLHQSVVRPGDQIDTNLDPTAFPPAGGGNAPPMQRFTESYLWLFGVNAGFEARW